MTPPVSDNEDAYNKLTAALHPSELGTVLEIAILPSSHPQEILYDKEHPALALPKSLLVQCYLEARKSLFRYLAAPENTQQKHHEALHATTVLLLYDPTHNTAANFRKNHIQVLQAQCAETEHGHRQRERGARDLEDAVHDDLRFLTALLTSPLSKHPKSSTLWSHRFWLVRNFPDLCVPCHQESSTSIQENHLTDAEGARTREQMRVGIEMGVERAKKLWNQELEIVMRAGERHPRNYYAWGYARQLLGFVDGKIAEVGERGWVEWVGTGMGMGKVHKWCLMHPRDVSGWGFLVFLMQRIRERGSVDGCESESGSEIKRVAWETREWVRKYEWRGESVEWFLKAVEQLRLGR
ncbi:hypothetical protein N7G274_006125 [Stereocaulon virgatum]|uniref:Protein prenylyltransferase n=1 Tax=Stereocaulon virgatum TaxID=373712 RepID=A0ABR4A8E0_9LECA